MMKTTSIRLAKTKMQTNNTDWEAHARELAKALRHVRSLIVEGAQTGFNVHSGGWAEDLFRSQSMSFKALKDSGLLVDNSDLGLYNIDTETSK